MLTKEQKEFFFDLFKNAFFLNEKSTIEEIYKKIEDPKISEIRDNLIREAEINSINNANLAVLQLEKKYEQIQSEVIKGDASSSEKFAEILLRSIEEKQKRKNKK